PLLEARREGRKLTIAQHRFTYLPGDSTQTWIVPVTIAAFSNSGASTRLNMILDQPLQSFDLPEDTAAYKINAAQTGCYLVKYQDPVNLKALGNAIRNKTLSPEDRWGLHADLSALLIRGDVTLEAYLNFLSHYDDEDAFLPLISIADALCHLWLILEDGRGQISAAAIPRLESILNRIGYEARPDEAYTREILRDQVLWQAALIGSRAAADFGRSQFALMKAGKDVSPDILKSAMQIGALTEGQDAFDWLEKRYRESASEQERVNVLIALGGFTDKKVIAKALDYVIHQVPARNQFIPIVSMAANPSAIPLLWDWYTANLPKIETFHPLLHERLITAIIPSAGLNQPEEIRGYFTDYLSRSEKAKDAIMLALEKMEINLRTRKIDQNR
ncbi:MAG: ERAP1-like C-terminal domain-containing protein, partial [Deltaproteobacteria bacterium]|nr:ERAP1-like C-terminal domain-containing protein [Deltaproteobacteria bacterium]